MSGIQRFVLLFIGLIYAISVIFKLTWYFICHPLCCVQSLKKKRSVGIPECLVDERYGDHEYITLQDIKLHYVINGDESKPLMLFLHGFPDFWYTWRNQLEEFSKTYRTVAVDLRGFGNSDSPNDVQDYLATKFRKDIADLVKALNYKSCILVAHDIGGTIAYHVATEFPDLVDKLIILNCPHPAAFLDAMKMSKSQKTKSWYMVMFQLPYLPELLLKVFDFTFLREICGGKLCSAIKEDELQAYTFMYSKIGFESQLNFYRAALSYRTTDTVRTEIHKSTLLVWGTSDPLLDPCLQEMSKKYVPDMKVTNIDNAGHWPHTDQPNEVNNAIREFLDQ